MADKYSVIPGDGVKPSGMLAVPATIGAWAPFDNRQHCKFRMSKDHAAKAAKAGRRQPLLEFWSVLRGIAPPISSIGYHENHTDFPLIHGKLSTLFDAHACFMGVKRPLAEDDTGANVVVYVLKPRFYYELTPDMVCMAKKVAVAPDLVFVAYARLDMPCSENQSVVKGVLTHWEFVVADSDNPQLPENHATRYDEPLWLDRR